MGWQQTEGLQEATALLTSLPVKPTQQYLILSPCQCEDTSFKPSAAEEHLLTALLLGTCGAFLLPLTNAAEVFTIPQVAHHHACLHEHQTALSELSHHSGFSLATQGMQPPPCPALSDQWEGDHLAACWIHDTRHQEGGASCYHQATVLDKDLIYNEG